MTKTEILLETAKFYGEDTSRRSIRNNKCAYKGENGKECAFQRCVVTDLTEYDAWITDPNNMFTNSALSIMNKRENLVFKEGYEGHSPGFWNDVQSLHDSHYIWDEKGITERGQNRLDLLLEKYKDN